MLRLAALLLACLLVPIAAAETTPLVPGVTWEQHVELTPHGPVAYTVITTPAPVGLTTIGPVLGGGTITGPRQSIAQLEESVSGNGIAGGVNGDFFSGTNAIPSGIVMIGGRLEHTPTPAHSSIGFDANGAMHVGRISFSGTWQGSGQRRPLTGVNQRPHGAQTVLFTPAWGPATPDLPNAAEVVLDPFPPATVGADLSASVSSAVTGPTPIPGGRRRARRYRRCGGEAAGGGAAGREGHGPADPPGRVGLGRLGPRRRAAAREGRAARLRDERELRCLRPHEPSAACGGRASSPTGT